MGDAGWFDGLTPEDEAAAVERIRTGTNAEPADWPTIATEAEVVADEAAYYAWLQTVAIDAMETELADRSAAPDREVIELVRTYDTLSGLANEFEQRLEEASTATTEAGDTALQTHLTALSGIRDDLEAELDALHDDLERQARVVAPNLAELAGPVLAARLIALAGSLSELAKRPSSTVQVLGAESALFAHLSGEAPPPKHGVIYTHPAIQSAPPEQRGTVARALAGKFAIAARIDHYRGEREPSLATELADRLETIRSGGDDA